MSKIRLGVNIDHIATLRNVRGEEYPDLVRAAILAQKSGADGITVHLREDRRHIRDDDVFMVKESIDIPLNLEIAATEEMLEIALKVKPNAVCIVPEKREELTTEGGLDVRGNSSNLKKIINQLRLAGIKVSLFLSANIDDVREAKKLKADIIEFHTGDYSNSINSERIAHLNKIKKAVEEADSLGIECHAGHGLNFENVGGVVGIKQIKELNIGHFLIAESVFRGLPQVIAKMKELMVRE